MRQRASSVRRAIDQAAAALRSLIFDAALINAQQIDLDDPTWLPICTPYNAVFLRKGPTGAPTVAVQLNYPWAAMIDGE